MPNRKIIYTTLFLLLALAGILAGVIFYEKNSRDLMVIFFDVGQGDAILISQGNNQLLIDGGKDGKIILEKLGKYIPFWDRNIEAVIATHPDQDHIGGLVDVAKAYNISAVLETGAQSDSQTYKSWEESVNNGKIEKIEAGRGISINFPYGGAKAEILYPSLSVELSDKSNANQFSVVMKLKFGENSFLFTGDLPAEQELDLIKNGVKSGILKVAHHGSKYSTSEEFLDAVNPEEAVISVGKNNSYGHPSPEIIERLLKHSVKIWRTDEIGDIVYQCKVPASPAGGQSEKPARNASPSDAGGCKVEFE